MDLEIKGIPDGITEAQVKEWVAIMIERKENAKMHINPAIVQATEAAKATIDAFRTANGLTAKFIKPVAEPKEG